MKIDIKTLRSEIAVTPGGNVPEDVVEKANADHDTFAIELADIIEAKLNAGVVPAAILGAQARALASTIAMFRLTPQNAAGILQTIIEMAGYLIDQEAKARKAN